MLSGWRPYSSAPRMMFLMEKSNGLDCCAASGRAANSKTSLGKSLRIKWRIVLGKSGQSLDSRPAAKNLSRSRAPHTCPLQRDRRPFWLVRYRATLRSDESVRERDVSSVRMRGTMVHYDLDPRRF